MFFLTVQCVRESVELREAQQINVQLCYNFFFKKRSICVGVNIVAVCGEQCDPARGRKQSKRSYCKLHLLKKIKKDSCSR